MTLSKRCVKWLRPLFVMDGVWKTGGFIDPNIAGKAYDETGIYFAGVIHSVRRLLIRPTLRIFASVHAGALVFLRIRNGIENK